MVGSENISVITYYINRALSMYLNDHVKVCLECGLSTLNIQIKIMLHPTSSFII